jgi:chromosome segregation ATPase
MPVRSYHKAICYILCALYLFSRPMQLQTERQKCENESLTQAEEREQRRAEKDAWRELAQQKNNEVSHLQQEKHVLREALTEAVQALGQWQEHAQSVEAQMEGLKERVNMLERQQARGQDVQIEALQERVKTVEGQQAKESQNSHMPPSPDGFDRPAKS